MYMWAQKESDVTVSPLREEEGKKRSDHRKNFLESSILGKQKEGTSGLNEEVCSESASNARRVSKSLGLSEKPVR